MEMEIDKKVLKFVTWILTNIVVMAVLIGALFYDVWWCQNFIKFYIWFHFIAVLLVCVNDNEESKERRTKNPAVPEQAYIALGVVWMVLLACFGWFFSAALAVITMALTGAIYYPNEKEDNGTKNKSTNGG